MQHSRHLSFLNQLLIFSIIYILELWDTAGQEDYDRLRPLSYSNTNVFILCFGLDSPVSLENCSQKWIYELRHYTPESTPILLVGTKLDIRRQDPASCIQPEEGRKMVQELGLSGYAECSSRTDEGLRNVFIEAVRLVLKKPEQKREKRCFVL